MLDWGIVDNAIISAVAGERASQRPVQCSMGLDEFSQPRRIVGEPATLGVDWQSFKKLHLHSYEPVIDYEIRLRFVAPLSFFASIPGTCKWLISAFDEFLGEVMLTLEFLKQ